MTDDSRPAIDGHEWPHAAASRHVHAGGRRWHVQRLGSGPHMLLIHGTGASCHSWERLADELRQEFTLTIVDLPGHGFTDPVARSEMTLQTLAGLIGELLRELGVAPRLVVGHSAGAAIAVRMALDRCMAPPDAIISINGALLPWRGVARWLFPPMARVLASSGLVTHLMARRARQPGAVEGMLAGTGRSPPARSVTFYKLLLQRPPHVQAALDMMAMWDLETLERDLPRLDLELILIACGEDAAVPPEAAFASKERVVNARVHYLRGLGHLAHEERPGEIADIIRATWRSVATEPHERRACGCWGG